MIAAGTGTYKHFQYSQRSEQRLRQASFVTSRSNYCLSHLTHKNQVDADAIICAHVNEGDQAVYTGDSGISTTIHFGYQSHANILVKLE